MKGTVLTFYSYKGGVGRTATLANQAVLLAQMNLRVLAVDWDLEAPGLHRYFGKYIGEERPLKGRGTIHFLSSLMSQNPIRWGELITPVTVGEYSFDFINAGMLDPQYLGQLDQFRWKDFFSIGGSLALERVRQEWLESYDIVLIDSRTGHNDPSGLCTIQLPDALIGLATANSQSIDGLAHSVAIAKERRRQLDLDRMELLVVPLLSRWEGRAEIDHSRTWQEYFEKKMGSELAAWLPRTESPAEWIEQLKIPYVPLFAFGELIAAVDHSLTDPDLPGRAYKLLADLISNGFSTEISRRPKRQQQRVFGSRPLVVPDFVERPQLVELLGSGSRVVTAIHGIGGVGKSQLAAVYFGAHQAEYDYAAWINMRDQDGLTDYASIASALKLDISSGNVAQAVSAAIRGSRSTWLLVFDNAESPEQVQPLLPDYDHAKVLITSRYRAWGQFAEVVNVDVFDPKMAEQFLIDQAKRPGDPHTSELAEALGYLPLALSLAGALCREQSLSFQSFLGTKLPTGLTASLNPDQPTTYDRAIDALWQESIKSIDQETADLLQVMSLLDWTSISRAWLQSTPLAQAISVDRHLAILANHSLVELNDRMAALKHNLIATGLTEAPTSAHATKMLESLFSDVPSTGSTIVDSNAWSEPLRHLRRLLTDHPDEVTDQLIDVYNKAGTQLNEQRWVVPDLQEAVYQLCANRFGGGREPTFTAAANLANAYRQSGRAVEAIAFDEAVLADRERLLGPDHPNTLNSRHNLANSYWQAGRTEEAIALNEAVLADRERLLGPDHPNTLNSRHNLANSYWQAGRTEEAVALDEAVLADRERLLGPDHPNTLKSRNNLATGYRQKRRNGKAIALDEAVLADRERVLGPDHPDTLQSRNNLATGYWQAGLTAEAIALHEAVLADRQRILGLDHPDTLNSRDNLATGYWQAGRTEEAIALDEAVLADRERVLGPDHPDTLISRSNLATGYRQAITLHEAMLADFVRVLGADHPKTLQSRSNLAVGYRQAGRTDEAITLEEAVLADRERLLGPDHPDTLISRSNLAIGYGQAGRDDEAITLNEAVLADRERLLGPDHPDTLTSRNNLAISYWQAGRTDEAITLEEAVLADRERLLGPDHPDTLTSRNNLAIGYRQAGRTDEAITLEEAVLADRERLLGPDHPDTLTSRHNLAVGYRQAGRHRDADRLDGS